MWVGGIGEDFVKGYGMSYTLKHGYDLDQGFKAGMQFVFKNEFKCLELDIMSYAHLLPACSMSLQFLI